jgi:hypothetical protein
MLGEYAAGRPEAETGQFIDDGDGKVRYGPWVCIGDCPEPYVEPEPEWVGEYACCDCI